MKRLTACLQYLIVICFLANASIAFSGERINMSPMRRPPANPQNFSRNIQSDEQAIMLFRRIIATNVQPYIGSRSAKASPAIVVGLVTEKGDVVEAFGTREIDKNLPPDGETLFGIGSVSKVFSGLILAKAVTKGDMSLSNKANKWLDASMQTGSDITMQHLVTHYSGLPNFPEDIATRDNDGEDMEISEYMPAKDYSKADLAACMNTSNCRSLNPPGKSYLYSNLGIGILSIALQNRYGYSDFNSMNQEQITNVLGMDNTATNIPDFLEKHKNNVAQGYMVRNQSLQPVPFSNMGVLAGSGELISNVNDMNKFLKSLTGLTTGALTPAVKESGRELAKIKPGEAIAYAQEIRHAPDGGKIYHKSGLTPGYTVVMLWRNNPKVGLILMANRGKFRPLKPIGDRLLEIITQQLQSMP